MFLFMQAELSAFNSRTAPDNSFKEKTPKDSLSSQHLRYRPTRGVPCRDEYGKQVEQQADRQHDRKHHGTEEEQRTYLKIGIGRTIAQHPILAYP